MDREWPEEKRRRFLEVAARHPLGRGVHDLLDAEPDIEVVAEVGRGDEVVDAALRALATFQTDMEVELVLLEGAGGRAFCAGGDIRFVAASARAGARSSVAIRAWASRERRIRPSSWPS